MNANLGIFLFRGDYADFERGWYSIVGASIVLTIVLNSFTVTAIPVAKLQYADCLDVANYDTPLKAHLHADRLDYP